jgi:hypothetical protein
MVSALDRIQTVVVAKQGPPGAGFTVAEKTDLLADIAALEADLAALDTDVGSNTTNIITLTADLSEARQGWATFPISGGGSVIPTGVAHRILIPRGANITADPVSGDAWRIGLDQSGSISLDLWSGSHASFPLTTANRISGTVGSQNPRVSSALKANSGSLTGWTVGLTLGNWLFINVSSVTSATYAALGLYLVMT